METPTQSFLNQLGFTTLRRLSVTSEIYLCREWATQRLLVAKFWPARLLECANRETRALVELDSENFLPRLGSVLKYGEGVCQLRTYLTGTLLADLAPTQRSSEKTQAFQALVRVVRRLHEKGWVHRDLTPSNILLSQQQVFLIDLDLAEKNSEQNLASFHPKGTVGFSSANKTQDLFAQDWEALEKIRIFLSLDKSVWRDVEPQNKARKSWLAELF